MKNKEEKINEISNVALLEILFKEKKNYNSKEMKTSDMVKEIKRIIDREVNKQYDIQKNTPTQL